MLPSSILPTVVLRKQRDAALSPGAFPGVVNPAQPSEVDMTLMTQATPYDMSLQQQQQQQVPAVKPGKPVKPVGKPSRPGIPDPQMALQQRLKGSSAKAGFPSAVLDLTNWSLALPIGTGGKPQSVNQPQLSSFQNEYFKVSADGRGVVFSAPVDGVTSKNSHYPRSELREMMNNKNAAWSTTRGTHTMVVTEAITRLPSKKPHVVSAQVHGKTEAPIMIRLEGSDLLVTSYGKNVTTLTKSYKLGTAFTVKIVAEGGVFTVFYDDKQAARVPLALDGCYFKAGVYTQSSTSKGEKAGEVGEVVIYDLKVTHS